MKITELEHGKLIRDEDGWTLVVLGRKSYFSTRLAAMNAYRDIMCLEFQSKIDELKAMMRDVHDEAPKVKLIGKLLCNLSGSDLNMYHDDQLRIYVGDENEIFTLSTAPRWVREKMAQTMLKFDSEEEKEKWINGKEMN